MKGVSPNSGPQNGFVRLLTRLFNAVGVLFGVVALLVVIVGAGAVAIFTGWSPVVLFCILWFVGAMVAFKDREPWDLSCFIGAVLIAWGIDTFLFAASVQNLPRSYRHFSPAIVVVSLVCGYVTWRLLKHYAAERTKAESNPLAFQVAFVAAIFLMYYVISPTMTHYFPNYWHTVTTFTNSDDSSPD